MLPGLALPVCARAHGTRRVAAQIARLCHLRPHQGDLAQRVGQRQVRPQLLDARQLELVGLDLPRNGGRGALQLLIARVAPRRVLHGAQPWVQRQRHPLAGLRTAKRILQRDAAGARWHLRLKRQQQIGLGA